MPAPKHRTPRRRRRSTVSWTVSIPILLIGVLVAAIFYAVQLSRSAYVPTDSVSLCRTDIAPPAVTVVLLDLTDALSMEEQIQIGYEFERLRSDMPTHGLLELYFLNRDFENFREPAFSGCNPGDGSEMNSLYQNPELARARWERDFNNRLDDAFSAALDLEDSDRSLIMEAIRHLSVTPFSNPGYDQSEKELVIISDLLQHNPGMYTQYRVPLESFNEFLSSSYFSQTRTDLRGVDIQLIYLDRHKTRRFQSRAHIEFWLDYLSHIGGRVQAIKKILGD